MQALPSPGAVSRSTGHGGGFTLLPSSAALLQVDQIDDSDIENRLVDDSDGVDPDVERTVAPPERLRNVLLQTMTALFISGSGLVAAGLLLDDVQHWQVMNEVPQLWVLVPALLGLKGNLEMTLSARLSTEANAGRLVSGYRRLVASNLALVELQALTVGFLAAVFACVSGLISMGQSLAVKNVILVISASLTTALLSGGLLGSVMAGLIILCVKMGVNPDNIATPVASSLGDVVTLLILSSIASGFNMAWNAGQRWLPIAVSILLWFSLPLWIRYAKQNDATRKLLRVGWTPILLAMVISSLGGMILERYQGDYVGLALFVPVLNGLGGNMASVHASRLSTTLNLSPMAAEIERRAHDHVPRPAVLLSDDVDDLGGDLMGDLIAYEPPTPSRSPCSSFSCFGGVCASHNAKVGVALYMLSSPIHALFLTVMFLVEAGHVKASVAFVAPYLVVASMQVGVLMTLASPMVRWFHGRGYDPDNFVIPYLTALGDVLGTGLLVAAFRTLNLRTAV